MDLARWLRFAIPGALFEVIVVGWLYADDVTSGWYPGLPQIGGEFIAALTAASLPIGFVVSTLMHTLKWRERFGLIAHMDDEWVLIATGSSLARPTLTPTQQRGFMDAVLHVRLARSRPALDRARSLLDLSNGQATSFLAVILSGIAILGVVVVKVCFGDHVPRHVQGHWALLAVYLFAIAILCLMLYFSQWRTARITEEYLIGAFREVRE